MSPARTFWAFVKARQRAWAGKNGLCEPTRDPVLQRARFTNVFRALDRGTLYSVYEVQPRAASADRVWATCMYRALNRIDAFEALIPRHYMIFRGDAFLELAAEWRNGGGSVFTGVYYSSHTMHGAALGGDGMPMDRRLAAYGDELKAKAAQLADHLGLAEGLEHATQLIRRATSHTLLGPFMVHQAALDLSYARGWADDWAHVGPGAKKGLALLGFGFHRTALNALRTLAASQPAIPWAPVNEAGAPARLSVPDVEHALCEWQKYERIKAGGHAKGVYAPTIGWRPPSPVPPWWRLPA